MVEDSALSVLSEPDLAEHSYSGAGKIIRLELDILGETVDLHIHVAQTQARLADIVPVARALSTKITDKVTEMVRSSGAHIPCCKGCSTCCSYYLVPLAVPEVFRLREETFAMPVTRRLLIEQACLSAAQRILDQPPPESFAEMATGGAADSAAELLNTTSSWYADFKLPCVFLYEGVCTIYEQRPTACREYSVTGSSRACGGGAGEPEKIYIPAKMSEILGQLASELEGTSVEALIMPLALIWADENPERDERTWPAELMVERFVELVEESVSVIPTALTAPAEH